MSDGKFTNYLPAGMTVKDTTRRMEILDMCWEYDNEEKVRKMCPCTVIFNKTCGHLKIRTPV